MSEGQLAADAQLTTIEGPILARDLLDGTMVVGVSSAGELVEARVESVELNPNAQLVRVLTHVGDVLASASASLASGVGPVPAVEVSAGPRALEFAAPSTLPRCRGQTTPFGGLSEVLASVPEEVANVERLQTLLSRAGLRHSVTARGGWVAVRAAQAAGDVPWTWADELELLLLLTAWPGDEEGVTVHRTRIADRPLRARLVGALTACGQDFDLRWLPAYLPVEARLVLAERSASAFTGVVSVEPFGGTAVGVTVSGAVALVADLVYVRLRRRAA